MTIKTRMKRLMIFILLFLCLSAIWLGYVLFRISQVEADAATPRKADVAIVLGAAVWEESPSPGLRERLDRAVILYKEAYTPYLLVTGGLGDGKKIDEATVMQRYLVEKGVPEERIILEKQARSTYQNLLYSHALMQEHSLETALVVSHSYHLARAMEMAESLQLSAYPVGVQSHVLMIPYHKAREVLAYTKWSLSKFLPVSR